MPVAVAALVRVIIQAAITTGIFSLLDYILSPLVDAAKSAVKSAFNMTDEEAEDSIANEIIDAFAMIGILSIAIKTKIPTRLAEKLGFTTKGYNKRPKSPKQPQSTVGTAAQKAVVQGPAVALSVADAQAVVTNAMLTKGGFKVAYDLILKTLGVGMLASMTIANWIDFGNWNSGAYQNTFQKIFATVSGGLLKPDEDYRKTKTASPDVFDKVYNTYKINGALMINDPFKLQSVVFSRDALIDLIDQVGATLLMSKGTASTKDVLLATQTLITFDTSKASTTPAGIVSQVATPATAVATSYALPKVFTGIVAQGVVGQGLTFTPRPDDLIESVEELRQAAANNLTPYLNTLLGKIVYEVKVVSSIITKEGFKQTGTTQQIKSGEYADGKPKYKTVTNKFATLIIYALTDKGSRTKLTTIVLGPTNSAKLTVAQDTLRTIETELPALVTTSDINAITGIATANAITVSTPTTAVQTVAPVSTQVQPSPTGTVAQAVQTVQDTRGASAQTLAEWYSARGSSLPSVEQRSYLYADFGLGNKAYYTGTSEQNTRLLNELKTGVASTPAGGTFILAEDDAPEGVAEVKRVGKYLYYFTKAPATTSSASTKKTVIEPSSKSNVPPKPKVNYKRGVIESKSNYEKRIQREEEALERWEKKYE